MLEGRSLIAVMSNFEEILMSLCSLNAQHLIHVVLVTVELLVNVDFLLSYDCQQILIFSYV